MAHDAERVASTERDPLLRRSNDPKRPAMHSRTASILSELHVPQTHSPTIVLLLLSVMIFVIMVSTNFLVIPQQRIYEDIICRRYYDGLNTTQGHISLSESIDEKMCKLDAIQQELATVTGVSQSLDCIPGLLFSFPYGMLADKWGRKIILGLAMSGFLMQLVFTQLVAWFFLPLRLIWLGAIFLSIGGGQAVVQNMVFATISDVSTDATRANNFFFLGSGTLLAEIFAPSAASLLMKKTSPWVPYLLATPMMAASCIFIVFIPETLKMHTSHGHITQNTPQASRDVSPSPPPSYKASYKSFLGFFSARLAGLFDALAIFKSPSLVILLFCFVLHSLGGALGVFFSIYLSRRFHWNLADTGFIMSYRAVVNLILLLVILPGMSYLLTRRSSITLDGQRWHTKFEIGLSTRYKDLTIARGSLFFLVAGSFLLGASPTIGTATVALTLWTFGLGFAAACRSLITTLVDQTQTAKLYAAISVIETVGLLAAGPLFSGLYSWGLKQASKYHNDAWIGTPLFGVCLICILFGGGVLFIRLPKEETQEIGTDDTVEVSGV